jgi:hypothetical protein
MFATKSAYSNVSRSFVRILALTVTVVLPLTPVGSSKWCANHPKLARTTDAAACAASAGGGGGATGSPGGTTPNLAVSVSPDPVQEVGTSEADFVVQVEAQAGFANQFVTISSQQLALDCTSVTWMSSAGFPKTAISAKIGWGNEPSAPVELDNDGNATVEVQAENCAPGTDLVEADLAAAPFTTVTTQLILTPPTPSFTVAGGPTITAAPNPEVETGDGGPGDAPSQVYVSFLIEENPVYAEGTVDVTSEQLTARCGLGTPLWTSTGGSPITSGGATIGTSAILDDDGNAVVTFEGLSCAPGLSTVNADLIGGSHDTFSTTYTINPPASVMPTPPVL